MVSSIERSSTPAMKLPQLIQNLFSQIVVMDLDPLSIVISIVSLAIGANIKMAATSVPSVLRALA